MKKQSAASVKARLMNRGKATGKTMQELLVAYGLGRTIYRLSVSSYAFPFATAVYTGYKIKPYNLSRLRKICKQKGIKLFKQCYSSQTALLSYKEEKI